MSNIINKKFELCYPIMESNKTSFIDKVVSLENDKNDMIELRIDYLLEKGIAIDEIIEIINHINSFTSKKIIVTIRTDREGGKYKLDENKYYDYIENIYLKTEFEYLDVEYNVYLSNKEKYEGLFKDKSKKIILSTHIYDKVLSKKQYETLFHNMLSPYIDIVKCAVFVNTKKELFDYMMVARKSSKFIINEKKGCIFIAMGEIGKLSRLWPEFTNTKVVFLTTNSENTSKIGQFSYENFVKYRKLLEKIAKN